MTRVAAVDCGTNTIRLLVADGEAGAAGLTEVVRAQHVVRLGQGVDATGEFHPDALARTFAAVDDFAEVIAGARVDRLRFAATSAARDAGNREDFFAGVRARLGVEAEIIAGEEEAELSFAGALAGVDVGADPALVSDVGGGSSELVLGRGDGTLLAATSLDIGSVRLRERVLTSDPVTPAQVAEATAWVDRLLDEAPLDLSAARAWVAVAGTATSLAAADLGLTSYDRALVHGAVVEPARLATLCARTTAAPVAELEGWGFLHPMRASVLGPGALITARIAARCGLPMTVSETDILDGIAARLLQRGSEAAE